MTFYVYLHCRPDGTPFYVGKGTKKRASNMKRNIWHDRIVNKYGEENIIVDLHQCKDEPESLVMEQLFILWLREAGVKLTNQTDGGDGVSNPTPQVRAKLASYGMLGKTQSQKQRDSVRRTHTGKVVSTETRRKMSEARKRHSGPNKGKPMSEAAKQNLREKATGRKHTEAAKAKMRESKKNLPPRSQETRERARVSALRRWQRAKEAAL